MDIGYRADRQTSSLGFLDSSSLRHVEHAIGINPFNMMLREFGDIKYPFEIDKQPIDLMNGVFEMSKYIEF